MPTPVPLARPAQGKPSPGLLALLLLPIVTFYAILFSLVTNLPLYDDYEVGMEFASHMVALTGAKARILWFAAAQMNEYKTYFGHLFVWLELATLGHMNFAVLSVIGDLFVLLLLFALWKVFLPSEPDRVKRLLLFVPAPFLICQLQYWETLNWPLPVLQNVPVVGFSLLAIYLLGKGSRSAYLAALAMMVLAIAASGNGFLLLPIGIMMLVLSRRWFQSFGWLAVAALSIAVYAYHYKTVTKQPGQGSMVTALMHPHIMYVLAFLGSAGATPVHAAAYALGLALILLFAWMLMRGYATRNATLCYCILFILLTAVGVAGIRTGGGLLQSISSRYRIYSDVLLVLAWCAFAEEFLAGKVTELRENRTYLAAVALSCIFWLGNDYVGVRSLQARNRFVKQGMMMFEHPSPAQGPDGPIYLPGASDPAWVQMELKAKDELKDAESKGVYTPPPY